MISKGRKARGAILAGLTIFVFAFSTICAFAHVKWFCAYAIERQPDGLLTVFNRDFGSLALVAIGALLLGTIVDETFVGRSLNRAFYRLRTSLNAEGHVFVRASCGFFLIALWYHGGIILTPELTTSSPAIPLLQLTLAACLVSRKTTVVAGVGIAGLFGLALAEYGLFHLADYPIFLGIAAYLIAVSLRKNIFGARPIDVLRWSTAITLMWASVEKWAYPEWSYPLFVQHPDLGFGFTPQYYMCAAGIVEFSLAFALLWTPLVRQIGAVVLTGIFVAATADFGKIDAIGHAPIIGVLLAIVIDDYSHEVGSIRKIALTPVKYACALAMTIGSYYSLHALLYGTSFL